DVAEGDAGDTGEKDARYDVNLRQAATRVFSNASGSYAANVNLAVENSTWENPGDLLN
ncbi:MAG: hypothetical protein HC839_04285, partial [Leptolyngbyaceae cyanobacterium RM2_2_21]|nr:hypothetical protein [Leptolyngbyaceae cyanobacterium RM2_2_21]